MTKKISLAIIWALLFASSLHAADQSAAVANKDDKDKQLLAQQGSAAGGETDPSFVPPPTTLISEPNQPQDIQIPAGKPIASTKVPTSTEPARDKGNPIATVDTVAAKPASKEIAKAVAQPYGEPPLPQPLYEPNQNGVVVLPGRTRASSEEGVANPFDIRLIAFKPVNELKIRVGGVVMGDKPTAMVNGHPFSASERWSGFNVVQVRKDALLLERDGVFVLIPRGRNISIKIPL